MADDDISTSPYTGKLKDFAHSPRTL